MFPKFLEGAGAATLLDGPRDFLRQRWPTPLRNATVTVYTAFNQRTATSRHVSRAASVQAITWETQKWLKARSRD